MAVNCSSHNLAQLEDIKNELRKDGFALSKLLDHDFKFGEVLPFTDYVPEDFDLWYGLLADRIDIINQHISDLCVFDKALRKEHDFNSDSDGDDSDG